MIFPRFLTKGNRIAIVAPAGKVPEKGLDEAIKTLSAWGLEAVLGKYVYNQSKYFAGSDANRLADLQNALNDPSIAAILCARGGYGVTRILPQIDWRAFAESPKWVIGFSDITALNLQILNKGIASIHGPMGTSFAAQKDGFSGQALKSLLFKGESRLFSEEIGLRPGSVTAEITGGNLSLIVDSLGTTNEIDTRDKILFIEEVGEKTYRIDRMLHQLLRAGKLNDLGGLVLGYFSEIDDGETPFGITWLEAVRDITQPFSYPVGSGFSIGHEPENMPVVMGGKYRLIVGSEKSSLIWQQNN
jgi:muramoyltetrapeptide carboxypeptidase